MRCNAVPNPADRHAMKCIWRPALSHATPLSPRQPAPLRAKLKHSYPSSTSCRSLPLQSGTPLLHNPLFAETPATTSSLRSSVSLVLTCLRSMTFPHRSVSVSLQNVTRCHAARSQMGTRSLDRGSMARCTHRRGSLCRRVVLCRRRGWGL